MALHVTHVTSVAIDKLRPTQLSVGYREVAEKRAAWQAMKSRDRASYLDGHIVPVVVGPKGKFYVIDHHHLARALEEAGHGHILAGTLANLSTLALDEFWTVMEHRQWVFPIDANGVRHPYDAIPKHVEQLTDDPWRSLSGAVRRAGGYAKESAPFEEFLWADFFRRRIDPALLASDFDAALAAAVPLSHSAAAAHLPGWSGAISAAGQG